MASKVKRDEKEALFFVTFTCFKWLPLFDLFSLSGVSVRDSAGFLYTHVPVTIISGSTPSVYPDDPIDYLDHASHGGKGDAGSCSTKTEEENYVTLPKVPFRRL